MATAQTIIDAAYRKIGEKAPTATDRTEALENLNNMISSWGIELLNYYYPRENFTLTAGDAEYTIGDGGDFDTVRPITINSAYIQDSNGYDYPLGVITVKDYDSIKVKTWEGRPENIYFVTEYPLAKIIFDCEPSEAYTLYITSEKNFTEFTGVSTTFSLPNEFKEALIYNLAITLAEDRQKPVPDYIIKRAKDLKEQLAFIRSVNRPAPEVTYDFEDQTGYNITTGE